MSELQELIQKLCPDGVEYKKLGDKQVSIMQRGTSLTKNNSTEGAYPVISGGRVPAFYCDKFNREGETITVAGSGAGAGYVQYWNEPIFVCDAFSIKGCENVSTKYLYYCLTNVQDKIYATKKGGGVPHVHISSIENFLIPIPHPAIQEEIVKILDRFADYAAELQAELQARKSQYEYYLNQLLAYPMEESDQSSLRSNRSATSTQNSNNPTRQLSVSNPHTGNSVLQPRGKVEWKTLGEIFNIKNGYTPSKSNQKYWENGTIPWFRMEDIRENGRVLNKSIQYVNSCAIKGGKLFPANSIIVATSATIGEHALITVPFLSNQRFTNLSLKKEYTNKFIIKFLFYYGFVLDEWCKNNITVGNFAGVDMIGFKKFLIPIPPLEEQERIVSILDKFDTLTTSLTEGLPKEIELRQKQYEYYRNMLLSFPKNNIKA